MCETCGWSSVLDDIEEGLGNLEDLPDRASDFADSVQDKLTSISSWIEENEHVTDGQIEAVENMCDGINRWLS